MKQNNIAGKLPTFFIPGATKAGTSSLYYYLSQHPQICMSKNKEPHFFDFDHFYCKGPNYYIDKEFAEADGYKARGEATPAYFRKPQKVIPRIKQIYGEKILKFIVLLREPVSRAWSHYLHRVRLAMEPEPFEKALLLESERLRDDPDCWGEYFSEGLYVNFIKQWLENFERGAFLFLLTEDLKPENINETLSLVYRFLGVDEYSDINTSRQNIYCETRNKTITKWLLEPSQLLRSTVKLITTKSFRANTKEFAIKLNTKSKVAPPKLNPKTKELLRLKYADSIKELQELIHRDLSHWSE